MQSVIESLERREHPSKLVHQYATDGTPVPGKHDQDDDADIAEEGGN
jgi:hypothetical protein